MKFLAQPIPIKLDYHNQSPGTLVSWIKSAPPAENGGLDVLVLIGHTKEHTDDVAFEKFLALAKAAGGIKVSGFGEIAEALRPKLNGSAAQRDFTGAFPSELMESTATVPMQNETARVRDGRTEVRDAAMNCVCDRRHWEF